MKLKERRQDKILQLIEMYTIETQEDLTGYLMREGFKTTQATVSRDIKDLHLIKIIDSSGKYYYAQSSSTMSDYSVLSSKFQMMLRESVTHVDIAQNIVVIKCYPGMAASACAAIDSLDDVEVVGTIAGDDTIFVAAYDTDGAYCIAGRITGILEHTEEDD